MKRIKTNEKSRQRNKAVKSALRTSVRRFNEALIVGDADKVNELAKTATRAYDKAVSKGVVHPNNAANHKSAIASKAAAL
jgi:small subunit ribosomal protein S20